MACSHEGRSDIRSEIGAHWSEHCNLKLRIHKDPTKSNTNSLAYRASGSQPARMRPRFPSEAGRRGRARSSLVHPRRTGQQLLRNSMSGPGLILECSPLLRVRYAPGPQRPCCQKHVGGTLGNAMRRGGPLRGGGP